MTSDWTEKPLGDVVIFENRRRIPVSAAERAKRRGPYPYWGANGPFDTVDDYLFEGPRVLIAEDGNTVVRADGRGTVHWADGRYWVNNHAHVLNVGPDHDLRWLDYALCTAYVRDFVSGSAQPKLSMGSLKQLPLRVPPLDEQRRIASVLGSIDEKIESNQAACRLLHELAEQAYRRALSASQAARLGYLGTIRGGGTPKSSVPSYWEPADVAWITPKDMTALAGSPVIWRGERSISQFGLQKSSAKLLPAGTVLYTSRATLGMIAIAQQELSTNQGFITVEPAPGLSSELVYFTLRANRDAIAAKANGSTFLEVNKTNFKAVECRIPDEGARAAFQSVAGPAFRLIAGLAQETQRLREVRDLLLPKLVSGQIRVPAGMEPLAEAEVVDLVESPA